MDNSIVDAEVFPKFYNVYRKDRNKYGGGVFILIRDAISSSQLRNNSPLENIWTRLHLRNHEDLIVGSFYCPPTSSLLVFEDLSLDIANIKQNYPHSKIILGGDFNCPGIDWEHGILMESYISQSFRRKFLEIIQNTQIEQLVTFPT